MTTLGLEWLKHRETQRHNLAGETETNRTNVVNEELKRNSNVETARANRANEGIKRESNAETRRSNLANEEIKRDANSENERHNLAYEKLTADKNAKDYEVSLRNVITNEKYNDAKIENLAKSLEESIRHNTETEYSNKVSALASILRSFGSKEGSIAKIAAVAPVMNELGFITDEQIQQLADYSAVETGLTKGSDILGSFFGSLGKFFESALPDLEKFADGADTKTKETVKQIFDAFGKLIKTEKYSTKESQGD